MLSWLSPKASTLTISLQPSDGNANHSIEIGIKCTVYELKDIIDELFDCNPKHQKLVFQGQVLEDSKYLVDDYGITDSSCIILMRVRKSNKHKMQADNIQNVDDSSLSMVMANNNNIFSKSNPFYSQSLVQNNRSNDNSKQEMVFDDSLLNDLAECHPQLPMAILEHSQSIAALLNRYNNEKEQKKDETETTAVETKDSLAVYYYHKSLESLTLMTAGIANSVYSMSHYLSVAQLQQLLSSNSYVEKEAIGRLCSLGFDQRSVIESYLVCDKNEVLAAVFLYKNRNETKGKEEEYKNISAHLTHNRSENAFFLQFSEWLRSIFDDDILYFQYLLQFMKYEITNLCDLEELNFNDQYLIEIGFDHDLHRRKILKEIAIFVTEKKKFELWFQQTIKFNKYLKSCFAAGIYSMEDMLLSIREKTDVQHLLKISNQNDICCVFDHVTHLRQNHSLYQAQYLSQKAIQVRENSPVPGGLSLKLSPIIPLILIPNAPPLSPRELSAEKEDKEGICGEMGTDSIYNA